MISKSTIQRINDEARVEDVVGEFVTLRKRGANLLGLCPFHNEKTPSFNVNPARNIYKCFGCGKAGGPIQFLMDYQQLTYPDTLRYLAKKYNIEIEEENVSEQSKQEEIERHNAIESLHIANAFAQKFYTDYMLNDDSGRIGLAYFKERGFLMNTIEKFQLGFSPGGYDVFTTHALKNGFSLEILKSAGLTSSKDNSKVDFFRNRVMFPIHNMVGKVVGFGGRIMVKDEKAPKYVNTSESEVYQKSKLLYGAFYSKQAIRKLDECLLVEGYTDVISLHQAGIENVVASSGTSLTVEQIRLIKRLTANITMLYDGDAAGIKAALRGTDLILEEGMNVRVVVLPDSEDPDSFVRKNGFEKFNEFVKKNKKDLISFKTGLFAQEAKADPIRKAEIIRDIISSIAKIPDAIQRSVYAKECSQLFDVAEQVVITEVNKIRRSKSKEQEKSREQAAFAETDHSDAKTIKNFHSEQLQESVSGRRFVEKDIIRILIEFGNWKFTVDEEEMDVTTYVLHHIEGIDIETAEYQQVFKLIKEEFNQGEIHDSQFFSTHESDQVSSVAIDMLAQPYSLSENWWNKYKIVVPQKERMFMNDIQSACYRLRQFVNIAELRKVEKMLSEEKDEEKQIALLKVYQLLLAEKKEFAAIVGNVIYRPTT